MVRGHRIRRMLGCAALPGQSHQAPQLLAALPSLFVPFQDRSVENLAANGLAGILNALQMTLARWSALSPKLTVEQKAYVHQCLSRGPGPIVSIVRNVSAISLQMALRCYFSRKCMRHLRQMQRMRVGADRSEDMPEVAAPPAQDLDYVSFDEFRSSVAARHILRAEAVHPGLLVRQSGTSPARGTPADVYRPDRRYTQDDAEGAMLLTADQRLSASVATFVRQMSHMLQQRERESSAPPQEPCLPATQCTRPAGQEPPAPQRHVSPGGRARTPGSPQSALVREGSRGDKQAGDCVQAQLSPGHWRRSASFCFSGPASRRYQHVFQRCVCGEWVCVGCAATRMQRGHSVRLSRSTSPTRVGEGSDGCALATSCWHLPLVAPLVKVHKSSSGGRAGGGWSESGGTSWRVAQGQPS